MHLGNKIRAVRRYCDDDISIIQSSFFHIPGSWLKASLAMQATLLVILAYHQVECYCRGDHISSSCEYYIHCDNDLEELLNLWHDISCPVQSMDTKYMLSLKNIDLDISWTSLLRNHMNTDRMKTIELIQVDKIPQRIKDFRHLEEIILTDWLSPNIELYSFLELNLENLVKIRVSNSSIVNLANVYYHGTTSVDSIEVSHNLIKTIPSLMFDAFSIKLRHLNLSHNAIEKIETSSFEGLNNLYTLDLSFNNIAEIGQSFVPLSSLKVLYLQNNNLTSIRATDLSALKHLEKLNLSYNVLNNIEDDTFTALNNLQEVDLSNNQLTRIKKVLFWSNTNLFRLLLAHNKIISIEPDAFKGKNIIYFDIKDNKLSGSLQRNCFVGISTDNLDLSFEKINSLDTKAFAGLQTQVLNLSNNTITTIDEKAFRGIELISELDLSNNNLTTIDFETENMSQLFTFSARNNQIQNVSQMTLKYFTALNKLDLSFNKITILDPKLFSDLNELQFLDLSNNLIFGSLKTNLFHGLSAVIKMNLESNRFTDIDSDAFSGLKALKVLNCSRGQLNNIHFNAFQNTGSLEILDLSQNLLNNFETNVTSISSVKELRLNDNRIRNVTKGAITGIDLLEKIYFANNNLMTIESKLFQELKNIKVLDLSNNHLVDSNEVLSNLSYLVELKLSNTRRQFNFENMTKVSVNNLDLSQNNIEDISKVFVYKINDIHSLDLHANKISSIDKDSFQNMHTLIRLDLSFNLITYIQPGSFLQTHGLQLLNLHENSLSTLQFGVFNGLYDLETLNLSSNALHDFQKTLLINTPKIYTIALDNNLIEHINFEEFVPSRIKLMTIGGNPISCHTIGQFIEQKKFQISAEILDHHNESVHGIRCASNSNIIVNSFENISKDNGSWIVYKEFERQRLSLEKVLNAIEKINTKLYFEESINLQKSVIDVLKSINESQNNAINYLKLQTNANKIDAIEDILKRINKSEKIHITSHETNVSDKNEMDHELQEKINILNNEKDKMVKEMLEVIEEFKRSKNAKSAVEDIPKDAELDGLKGILYFIAVCFLSLILFGIAFIVFKFVRPRYRLFKTNNEASCSTQQMANIIELQEN
ncbi:leucine rich repeat domain-containing protein [Phthorimaea operculella]|nr:leucine rich repeat domain-containing protein [Phthorimaea operculella]